jgi:hypothetical protein
MTPRIGGPGRQGIAAKVRVLKKQSRIRGGQLKAYAAKVALLLSLATIQDGKR